MKKFLIESTMYLLVWIYHNVPLFVKRIRKRLQAEVKFNLNTFVGIGLGVYFAMIVTGNVDHFAAFQQGITSLRNEKAMLGQFLFIAPMLPMIAGVYLIVFKRRVLVVMGYMLVAIQVLVMTVYEDPKTNKTSTEEPRVSAACDTSVQSPMSAATRPLPPLV